jgi:hypothetical protein
MWYRLKYRYPTREIATVVLVGFAIVWFIWGSVQAMQKNYELRRRVDGLERQAQLVELEMRMLEYEQRYLTSEEYQKLAVRERLGYGDPGEKMLLLPPNSEEAKRADASDQTSAASVKPSNVRQWLNFLFGGNVRES